MTDRRLYLLFALLALVTLAYTVDIGGSSIWDANEAYYVETPREMLERGDWVNPSFNYEPRFNKPVLAYWIVGGLYRVFGVSVGVERVAIAACALVMIAAAWFLARATSSNVAAPVLAALGLAANPRMFMLARRILIDLLLAALMTVILLFFALAERYPQHRRRFLVLMYVAVGLGVLAKGPVAAVLPAIAFALYLTVNGEWRRISQMMLPAGVLIALAVAAPWYIALYMQGGWTHISGFFIGENIDRYTSMFMPSERGPLFYLPVLLSDSLPWSLCLPAVVAFWLRDRRMEPRGLKTPGSRDFRTPGPSIEFRLRTLLFLWIAVIVGFFSFSQTKQDLYVLPIVVAVAVLGGDFVARTVFGAREPNGWLRSTLLLTAVLLAAAGGLAYYIVGRSPMVSAVDGVAFAAAAALAGGIAMAVLVIRRHAFAAVAVLMAVLVLFNWTLVLRVLPSYEIYKPAVPFSDTIRKIGRADDTVLQFQAAMPSMVFYLQRHIDMVEDEPALMNVMTPGKSVLAIFPERRYEELKEKLPPMCVVDRRPTATARLRDVLEGRPPTMLVLVSTRCQ